MSTQTHQPLTRPQSTVWPKGADGLVSHHVFGLCQSRKGTILVFAEGRLGRGDTEPHHLVCRRSLDGGQTWLANQVLRDAGASLCYANPTPLVDARNGRIHLFFAINEANQRTRLMLSTSDDDGVTWSADRELTQLFASDPLARPFHLPGPGHGLQLASGRLVLPVWHRLGIAPDFKTPPWDQRLYSLCAVFSDDGGATWQAGEYLPVGWHANEARLVALPDGTLLVNARGVGFMGEGARHRIVACSPDQGLTWGAPAKDESAGPGTPCDAGLVALPPVTGAHGPALLLSRPNHPSKRLNQTISYSPDGGQSWTQHRLVSPVAGYSDLVVLQDGSLGLLYDASQDASEPGIRFVRFFLGDLLA